MLLQKRVWILILSKAIKSHFAKHSNCLYYKIKVTSVLVYGIIINMSVHLVSLFGIGEKYLWWKITAIFSQVLHLCTYTCLYFAFTCFMYCYNKTLTGLSEPLYLT